MPPFNEHKLTMASLQIEDLSLSVRLGCTASERAIPQEIRISIEFRFQEPPIGALSDSLSDTICYAKVSQRLREHFETTEFNLIERIGAECFGLLRELIQNQDTRIRVHIHKVRPPVDRLLNGTHFVCGDFLA